MGHPHGFDLALEPIEAAAKRAAELFVSIERGLESRRVASAATRSTLQDRFAGTLGENGVGLLSVLDERKIAQSKNFATVVHSATLASDDVTRLNVAG